MVVIEALSRAIPVIATDVGGLSEALGFGAEGVRPGLLVAPDDSAVTRRRAPRLARGRRPESAAAPSRARPARVAARVVDHGVGDRGAFWRTFRDDASTQPET